MSTTGYTYPDRIATLRADLVDYIATKAAWRAAGSPRDEEPYGPVLTAEATLEMIDLLRPDLAADQ
jgi:hypothetical protein